jgi:SAM-dependent methyltransferase
MDVVKWDAEVLPMDGRMIPLSNGSVDAVLLSQVLGDVADPGPFLVEVARVLRPSGRLLVFETMAYPEHDLPNDYYRLMPEGLRLLAQQAGLRCTELVRLGGLFARFAMLWNIYVMGRVAAVPGFTLLARAGIVAANVAALALDRAMPHPSLATDYAAVLIREASVDDVLSKG